MHLRLHRPPNQTRVAHLLVCSSQAPLRWLRDLVSTCLTASLTFPLTKVPLILPPCHLLILCHPLLPSHHILALPMLIHPELYSYKALSEIKPGQVNALLKNTLWLNTFYTIKSKFLDWHLSTFITCFFSVPFSPFPPISLSNSIPLLYPLFCKITFDSLHKPTIQDL